MNMGGLSGITRDRCHPKVNLTVVDKKLIFNLLTALAQLRQQADLGPIRDMQGRIAPLGKAHFNKLPQP